MIGAGIELRSYVKVGMKRQAQSGDEDRKTRSRWSIDRRHSGSRSYYLDYCRCGVLRCMSRHGVK
jgi:hypothetical protein